MENKKSIKTENPIPPVAPARPSQEDFVKEYNILCKRMGWTLDFRPAFREMKDLGGSLIVVQLTIVPYQEPKS